MWTPLEKWQVSQLEHLAVSDPDRVEAALNALWESHPELLETVTISALDKNELSLNRAAELLRMPSCDIEKRLAEFKQRNLRSQWLVVSDGSDAKLADGSLPVWEIVRVYRRLGSKERLQKAFTGISRATLDAALAYAESHANEIDRQIEDYEALLAQCGAER